jgi:3-phosphoshikimate 1-carboxyvinyltransferase
MSSVRTATVTPARRLQGQVRVPGDKSISHRYALLAALSEGRSELHNYAPGGDCRSTLRCLAALGIDVSSAGSTVTLMGRGLGAFRSPAGPLDAGNSGTTMRMLTGILAGQRFDSQLTGDHSLSRRPMRRVIEPLSQMGASIDAIDGHPPLTVHGRPLTPVHYTQPVPSAQVKSAILLAGLHADGTTSVTEPARTRDHTERALAAFGFVAETRGLTISIRGHQTGRGQSLPVPGDFSSAAFWMVAAAALPGSVVTIEDVGLNPTRTALIGVLRKFGAHVDLRETATAAGEPIGTIIVTGDQTGSVHIQPHEVPELIDELPAIAALAAHSGEVCVDGAAELRIKESDRISALVTGFRALGIHADERPDGFTIHGSGAPAGGVADAAGDHRLAMALAIAALAAEGPSQIQGADVVSISYPGFFETLDRLVA